MEKIFLSCLSKLLVDITFRWLSSTPEIDMRERQIVLRPGWSAIDQIFSLWQILEHILLRYMHILGHHSSESGIRLGTLCSSLAMSVTERDFISVLRSPYAKIRSRVPIYGDLFHPNLSREVLFTTIGCFDLFPSLCSLFGDGNRPILVCGQ